MNRKVALIAGLFAASLAAVAQNAAKANENVALSIPHVTTAASERIVGFEIELTAGMVQSISNIPLGWDVQVDNDPSWRTTIKGNIKVGAAALDANEFCKLRIAIQKDTTYSKFSASGKVVATADFEKTRNIPLVGSDFKVAASNLLDGQFKVVSKTEGIQDDVKQAFDKIARQTPFAMANPGEPFQVTDVVAFQKLPWRRLVFAGVQGDMWFLHYERGGLAHSYYVVAFKVDPHGEPRFVWGCSTTGAAKTLEQLRTMVAACRLSDDARSYW